MPQLSEFTIAAGFNGPPDSANGGYACGRLALLAAEHLDGLVTVALLAPVPMDTPLRYEVAGGRGRAWANEELIATVSRTGANLTAPPPLIPPAAAAAAAASFTGAMRHPFPTCFACGPDRGEDGLRLAPGPVVGRPGLAACLWSPDARHADPGGMIRPEVVWAALDCPGGWTTDPVREPRLLGRMSASVRELPRTGQTLIVVAQRSADNGPVALNATALFDAVDGRLLASASAHWAAYPGHQGVR